MMLRSGDHIAIGPLANASIDFTHYPCGKAWAIQGSIGIVGAKASFQEGEALSGLLGTDRMSISMLAAELGATLKLRLHDYHRPREFAFVIGPKLWVPALLRQNSGLGAGPLKDAGLDPQPLLVGGHIGLQFRRPAPDKKAWFIEPGLLWMPMPLFNTHEGHAVAPLSIYLNFGFAFWDQRG